MPNARTLDAVVVTEGFEEHAHKFNIGDEIEVTKDKVLMGVLYAARRKSDGAVQGLSDEDFKPINLLEH